MKTSKVWLIVGAKHGLGPAAIKYLLSKKQVVVALLINENTPHLFFENTPSNLHVINIDTTDTVELDIVLKNGIGQIDYIINNSNYQLFHNAEYKTFTEIRDEAIKSIADTITLIRSLLPYLRKKTKGRLINIPPQLCLATLPGNADAVVLSSSMEFFLNELHQELKALNYPLTFLEPGERQGILID